MSVISRWFVLILLFLSPMVILESGAIACTSCERSSCADEANCLFVGASKAKKSRAEAKSPNIERKPLNLSASLPQRVLAQSMMTYLNLHELLGMEQVSHAMKAAARLNAQTALALECDGNLPKLDYAKRFPQLKSFRIRRAILGADDLNRLAAVKTLTELDLVDVGFVGTGFDRLLPFSELLVFRATRGADNVLPNLNSGKIFPKLQKFNIQGLTDTENFRDLIENPNNQESLQEVVVSVVSYDARRSSPYLSKLRSLRVLSLKSWRYIQLPTLGLANFSFLSHLEMVGLVLSREDLTQLSRLKNLVELNFKTQEARDFDGVGELKNLRSLNWESLEGGEITAGLSFNEKFPALRTLHIEGAEMNSLDQKLPPGLEVLRFATTNPERLSNVGVLPNLKALDLVCVGPEHPLPNSLHQIVPNLTSLSLNNCSLKNIPFRLMTGLQELRLFTQTASQDLLRIGQMLNLEALSVNSTVRGVLPRIALERNFPKLRRLTLTNISMEFSHLAESVEGVGNSLETLEVLNSELTGNMKLSLSGLTKLWEINLSGTQGGQEGLVDAEPAPMVDG